MHLFYPCFLLLLLSLATASCVRDPACEGGGADEQVVLELSWPDTGEELPATVFVACYRQGSTEVISNFVPTEGGAIFLPAGRYDLLFYTDNAGRIGFRQMESFALAQAHVKAGLPPTQFFYASTTDLAIDDPTLRQTIRVQMVSGLKSYPFRFREIVNGKYLSTIQVSLSGISPLMQLATGEILADTFTTNCLYTLTADGLEGTLSCFGHGSEETPHRFVVRFEYGGRYLYRTYVVTDMLNKEGVIDIYDRIVFEPPGDEAFSPDVGDWDDDSVVIPIQ